MSFHKDIELLNDLASNTQFNVPVTPEKYVKISFCISTSKCIVYEKKEPELPFAASDVVHATFESGRLLTSSDVEKPVYEMTLNIENCNWQFRPGDTIGVLAKNHFHDVNYIIERVFKNRTYYTYEFKPEGRIKIPPHVPIRANLSHVLENCLDLRSIVKKTLLLTLSKYTENVDEKRVLQYLSSKEGSNEYNTYVLNKRLNIINILKMFHTCQPPIEILLLNLPRLLPRPYSIVNKQTENQLKICFSVAKLENGSSGLVTSYLQNIIDTDFKVYKIIDDRISFAETYAGMNTNPRRENDFNKVLEDMHLTSDIKIPIYLRKNMNNFSIPNDFKIPLILIGPGTGVAPYIGFLEERCGHLWGKSEVYLFFGCKHPDTHHIYKKEMLDFVKRGVLTKYLTAFSRCDGGKYVQDLIKENGQDVTKLIEKGAMVFVCGDKKEMASQVRDEIKQSLVEHGGKTVEEAESLIVGMEKEKKYVVDVWC